MKALTICQPYAHLIAIGEKRVENRTWYTPYRGLLAIHAGKSREWLALSDEARYPNMAFGAVIAFAKLVGCVRLGHLDRFVENHRGYDWLLDHEHAEGPFCWILSDVFRLADPIPARGHQGLFNLDVLEQIRASAHG